MRITKFADWPLYAWLCVGEGPRGTRSGRHRNIILILDRVGANQGVLLRAVLQILTREAMTALERYRPELSDGSISHEIVFKDYTETNPGETCGLSLNLWRWEKEERGLECGGRICRFQKAPFG